MSVARCLTHALSLKVDCVNPLSTYVLSRHRPRKQRFALPSPGGLELKNYIYVWYIGVMTDESLVVDCQIAEFTINAARRPNARLEVHATVHLVKVIHGEVRSQVFPQLARRVRKVT